MKNIRISNQRHFVPCSTRVKRKYPKKKRVCKQNGQPQHLLKVFSNKTSLIFHKQVLCIGIYFGSCKNKSKPFFIFIKFLSFSWSERLFSICQIKICYWGTAYKNLCFEIFNYRFFIGLSSIVFKAPKEF